MIILALPGGERERPLAERLEDTSLKWAHGDSNTGPHPYQGCALAN